jgi:Spy/CpxP family protein refolding chaperone
MSEMSATWKAALWVSVVFLLGAALGGVVGYSYEHHLVSAASTPLPEPVRRGQRIEELTKLLSLTSAQSQQIDAILLERHTEVKTIHDQTDAQIDQVRQRGRDQIRAILTAEQKPKFEDFLRDLDQKRKHAGSK